MEHTKGELSLNNYHFPYAFLVIRNGALDNDAHPGPRRICDIVDCGKHKAEVQANAERLVKCWNSYDDLLEACKKAEIYLSKMQDMQRIQADGIFALVKLQGVIAKAKA